MRDQWDLEENWAKGTPCWAQEDKKEVGQQDMVSEKNEQIRQTSLLLPAPSAQGY